MTNRTHLTNLAGTVAGMLTAAVLLIAGGVVQAIDDTDAQKLSQMIAERK